MRLLLPILLAVLPLLMKSPWSHGRHQKSIDEDECRNEERKRESIEHLNNVDGKNALRVVSVNKQKHRPGDDRANKSRLTQFTYILCNCDTALTRHTYIKPKN